MNFPTKKSSKGFLRRFSDLVDEYGACEEIEIAGSVSLGGWAGYTASHLSNLLYF
jgi:hypothetical protein